MSPDSNKETLVISAFPGTGKSYLSKIPGFVVSDSDSSRFQKDGFPDNYLRHIKGRIGKVDILCVSSHDTVREAMVKEGIPFVLVYPSIDSKNEYLNRYLERGSNEHFINMMNQQFEKFIEGCKRQENCQHIELLPGQYLSDIIKS